MAGLPKPANCYRNKRRASRAVCQVLGPDRAVSRAEHVVGAWRTGSPVASRLVEVGRVVYGKRRFRRSGGSGDRVVQATRRVNSRRCDDASTTWNSPDRLAASTSRPGWPACNGRIRSYPCTRSSSATSLVTSIAIRLPSLTSTGPGAGVIWLPVALTLITWLVLGAAAAAVVVAGVVVAPVAVA